MKPEKSNLRSYKRTKLKLRKIQGILLKQES